MMAKSKEQGLEHYLKEAAKEKQAYLRDLIDLTHDLKAGNFKRRDYLAAERLLQIFTELCIGLAKHCSKKLTGEAAADAYQTFKVLADHQLISTADLTEWRKIIGFRNGLVHDYLNIDPAIVERIISQQSYQRLNDFSDQAIHFLQLEGSSVQSKS